MSCGPIFCDQNDPYNNSNIFLNKNRAFLLKASQASKAINPLRDAINKLSDTTKGREIDAKPFSSFLSCGTGKREHIYLKEVPSIA
jgi:hypothetical protein